MRDLLSTLP